MLTLFLRDGLLAVGVLCGPGLWLVGGACAYAAWRPGIDGGSMLELLYASFVLMCWALWGINSGPWRLRLWWFGLASLLNMLAGGWIVVSGAPHSLPIGALFLAYSLWQFFVFRRRWTYKPAA